MESTATPSTSENTNQAAEQTKKYISKTAQWARAHKWCIEIIDPELQAQCKSYKNGQKIISNAVNA